MDVRCFQFRFRRGIVKDIETNAASAVPPHARTPVSVLPDERVALILPSGPGAPVSPLTLSLFHPVCLPDPAGPVTPRTRGPGRAGRSRWASGPSRHRCTLGPAGPLGPALPLGLGLLLAIAASLVLCPTEAVAPAPEPPPLPLAANAPPVIAKTRASSAMKGGGVEVFL